MKEIKMEELKSLTLERIGLGTLFTVNSEAFKRMDIRYFADSQADNIITQFSTKILGNKKQSTCAAYFEVPQNWFECLKEERFPKWIKKRFPVKYTTITQEVKFTTSALFPELEALENKFKIVYYGS